MVIYYLINLDLFPVVICYPPERQTALMFEMCITQNMLQDVSVPHCYSVHVIGYTGSLKMDACQGCLNKITLTLGKFCFRGKFRSFKLKKKKTYSRKKTPYSSH